MLMFFFLSQVSASLGTRRAKIKAESFTRKAFDRFGQEMEGDDCNSVQKKLNEDNVGELIEYCFYF